MKQVITHPTLQTASGKHAYRTNGEATPDEHGCGDAPTLWVYELQIVTARFVVVQQICHTVPCLVVVVVLLMRGHQTNLPRHETMRGVGCQYIDVVRIVLEESNFHMISCAATNEERARIGISEFVPDT